MMMVGLVATMSAQSLRVVEGQLVNRTDPAIVTGSTNLEVISLSGGMDTIKTTVTDTQGKFRIEGLPESVPLMLRAIYKGVNYHRMLNFDAGGTARLEVEVLEPTTSLNDIRVKSATLAFQLEGDHLHAIETWEIENQTTPPRVHLNPEGSFHISKAPSLSELPTIRAAAAGSEMPLTQPALEGADGKSYYSRYPLRPGLTIFEVRQTLPYTDSKYIYAKKFFMDTPEITIGVIPADMTLSGNDLVKTEINAEENFAVYSGTAVKAGTEVTWTFSGGTPVAMAISDEENSGSETMIIAADGVIGRNALVIGPLLLLVFIVALWVACNRLPDGSR